jgi:hypothetical protein
MNNRLTILPKAQVGNLKQAIRIQPYRRQGNNLVYKNGVHIFGLKPKHRSYVMTCAIMMGITKKSAGWYELTTPQSYNHILKVCEDLSGAQA